MHILMLNYEYPPLGGGTGNAMQCLLEEFSKQKDLHIDVVTSSTDKAKTEQCSDSICIHYLDIGKNGKNLQNQSILNLLMYSWKCYWYSRKLIKGTHYNFCHAFFTIPCGYIAMKLGIPYMVSLRGSDVPFHNARFSILDRVLFKRLCKQIWKRASANTSVSKYLEQRARLSCASAKISVIPNGVHTSKFTPTSRKDSKEVHILFVGRLSNIKGVPFLLEGFSKLSAPHAHLHFVGDGPLKSLIEEFVKNYNLEHRVHVHGAVSHDDIHNYYAKTDIFILPSIHEGMPNAVLEAMASGLPIVTTETGAAELIDGNGLIVEKESSTTITSALKQLLENEDMRKQMGSRGRELAEGMSWSSIAKQYIATYEQLI